MNYGKIYRCGIANGPGIRTELFVSGCTHHCKGCFNQETWDFNYGTNFGQTEEDEIIESLKPPYVAGLSILGGEPMELVNQEVLAPFLSRLKKEVPHANIWLYSGYRFEELTDQANKRCHGPHTLDILSLIDVLVDGEFVLAQKNIALKFRGSENQRLIDVPAALAQHKPVLAKI